MLRELDLAIEPSQIVAVVGGTGAGKSTLLSLVPRFYDPTVGRVAWTAATCDKSPRNRCVRRLASCSRTRSFSTTVRENIAYGRPDATESEIHEAARRAQAEELINRMPSGYRHPVGERDGDRAWDTGRDRNARPFGEHVQFSSSTNPPRLSIGHKAAITDTLKELIRGRTTLIVTHRLATIHGVDRIIVLEHGRLVEQGTGSELLARGGQYAKLYAAGNYPGDA